MVYISPRIAINKWNGYAKILITSRYNLFIIGTFWKIVIEILYDIRYKIEIRSSHNIYLGIYIIYTVAVYYFEYLL